MHVNKVTRKSICVCALQPLNRVNELWNLTQVWRGGDPLLQLREKERLGLVL